MGVNVKIRVLPQKVDNSKNRIVKGKLPNHQRAVSQGRPRPTKKLIKKRRNIDNFESSSQVGFVGSEEYLNQTLSMPQNFNQSRLI